jgi:hypothetical protein
MSLCALLSSCSYSMDPCLLVHQMLSDDMSSSATLSLPCRPPSVFLIVGVHYLIRLVVTLIKPGLLKVSELCNFAISALSFLYRRIALHAQCAAPPPPALSFA